MSEPSYLELVLGQCVGALLGAEIGIIPRYDEHVLVYRHYQMIKAYYEKRVV